MATELFADNAATTLTSSPSAGATSFTVTSSAGFPAPVAGVSQFRVIIGTEIVTVTGVSGTTWTCAALAAGHSSGDAVTHVIAAAVLSGLAQGSPANQRGAWAPGSTYAVGDVVTFRGGSYIATAASPVARVDDLNRTVAASAASPGTPSDGGTAWTYQGGTWSVDGSKLVPTAVTPVSSPGSGIALQGFAVTVSALTLDLGYPGCDIAVTTVDGPGATNPLFVVFARTPGTTDMHALWVDTTNNSVNLYSQTDAANSGDYVGAAYASAIAAGAVVRAVYSVIPRTVELYVAGALVKTWYNVAPKTGTHAGVGYKSVSGIATYADAISLRGVSAPTDTTKWALIAQASGPASRSYARGAFR